MYDKFRWSSGLKVTVFFFVILQSQDAFKCDPQTKLQTATSWSQFRSSRAQMFFEIGVLKSSLQVFSREYCKVFKNTVFIENLR